MVALFVALGGTAWAVHGGRVGHEADQGERDHAAKIRRGAVTTPKLAPGAVTGAKIANDTITGAQVDEATLGTVARATVAANADHADTVRSAQHADTATDATNAINFSRFHTSGIVKAKAG